MRQYLQSERARPVMTEPVGSARAEDGTTPPAPPVAFSDGGGRCAVGSPDGELTTSYVWSLRVGLGSRQVTARRRAVAGRARARARSLCESAHLGHSVESEAGSAASPSRGTRRSSRSAPRRPCPRCIALQKLVEPRRRQPDGLFDVLPARTRTLSEGAGWASARTQARSRTSRVRTSSPSAFTRRYCENCSLTVWSFGRVLYARMSST